MKITPWISAALVAALFVTGPLAPMAAFAQAPQTAPPVEPSLTSQKLGQERVPVDPVETMLMPSVEPITSKDPTDGDATAAGFMNVVYVPGKAIICTAGVLTSTLVMLLTFGTAYRAARGVFLEGCSAPWALTADYVSGKIPGPGDPGYDPSGRY
ncbi:MAG: hypothetical protein Q7W02_08885 [Candidatus Rokubacteria bacterium]|nr:hypothetical protein [Candidatus Rokubacteria bacterium]